MNACLSAPLLHYAYSQQEPQLKICLIDPGMLREPLLHFHDSPSPTVELVARSAAATPGPHDGPANAAAGAPAMPVPRMLSHMPPAPPPVKHTPTNGEVSAHELGVKMVQHTN